MFIPFDSSGMVAVFPECTFPPFTLIELLGCPPRDQLDTVGDDIRAAVDNEQVEVTT